MSRLFVHYEDHASAEMHKTSKITLPKKWLSGPCTALLELFVKTYNGKVRGWLSPPVKMMPFTRNLILSAACSLRNQPVSRKPVGHQLHAPRKREGYVTGQLMRCVFFWNCRQSTPHALALSAGEALANECVVSEFVGPSADVYVKHGPPPMLSAVTAARLGDSAAAAAAAVPPPVRTGVDASPRAAGPPAGGGDPFFFVLCKLQDAKFSKFRNREGRRERPLIECACCGRSCVACSGRNKRSSDGSLELCSKRKSRIQAF